MTAFGVGGVMAIGDQPILSVGFKIGFEPPEHQTVLRPIAVAGIKADEMNVGVVEGIVSLRARHQAAGLRLRGQAENIVINSELNGRVRAARIMIADAWP